jgi:hypothetical protein
MIDNSVDYIIKGIQEMKTQDAAGVTENTTLRASEWRDKIAEWIR